MKVEITARRFLLSALLLSVLAFPAVPAFAEMSNEALAKAAQNPVANMISIPFQNNTNFNVGPYDRTQNILNIQPVIPVSVNKDWNVITRTIAPLIWQPGMAPGQDSTFGLGDIQFTAFLSPAKSEELIWGAGPILQLPTHTNDVLGTSKWGIGPSFVALKVEKVLVYGALVNNVWSFAGPDGAPDINKFLLQPFVNYNFGDGMYITSAPIITADWEADSDNQWTVPLGGGIGKIVRVEKLPLNLQAQLFYNVVTPDYGPNWTLRLQVQLMLPKF